MSKQYFYSYISHNNGYTDDYEVFYIEEDNTTDYRKIVDINGNPPELKGEDDYFAVFSAMMNMEAPDKVGDYVTDVIEISWSDLPDKVKDSFSYGSTPSNTKTNEPDWKTLRIRMAGNFMANMLNADETFRTKLVDDILYKQLAKFSVACADTLIEELKKN